MFDFIPPALANAVGLSGVVLYLLAYALLQLGFIRGQGYSYATLNILAASCVLFSLTRAFNTASLFIQISFILISMIGMIRLYIQTNRVRFTDEERAFYQSHFPDLQPHLARQFMKAGAFEDFEPGYTLTVEGQPVELLHYLSHGQIEATLDGRHLGFVSQGAFIGESAIEDQASASATTTVVRPSRGFVISTQKMRRLFHRVPEIKLALLAAFAISTRETLQRRNLEFLSTQAGQDAQKAQPDAPAPYGF